MQALGYKLDTTGIAPVENCMLLHIGLPIQNWISPMFLPIYSQADSKSCEVKYFFNHNGYVLLVRCPSGIKKRRDRSLELRVQGRLDDYLPGHLFSFEYIWRVVRCEAQEYGLIRKENRVTHFLGA
jgi:hypothetical protein